MSRKRALGAAFMIAVVCFPPRIRAGQAPSQPSHQTTEKKTEKKSDQNKKADEEGAEKKPPAKSGESKNQELELTRVDAEVMTASDSLQEISLMVNGAADGEKLNVELKNPDGKAEPEQEATVNKGVVKIKTKLSEPGTWGVTVSNKGGSSKPYSLTVRDQQGVCRAQPTATQVEVFRKIFSVMTGVVVMLFALLVLGLIVAAFSKNGWSLGDALSEESSVQPKASEIKGRAQVVMVASSSRIIAVFGLAGILALVIGIGYAIVWNLVVCGTSPDLSPIKAFLVGMATIFAPYLANQLREAFSPSNPTEKAEPAKAVPSPPSAIKITGIVPAVRSVDPNPQRLNLFGAEFQAWMSVTLVNPDGGNVDVPENQVEVGGPNQIEITTTLDRGGTWKAVVTSAAGTSSPAFPFAVRAPAPTIGSINPPNPVAATAALTIDGTRFMPNAVATLIAPDGTETKPPSSWTSANQMSVRPTLSVGNQWRLRIVNPSNDQPAEFRFNVA